MTQQAKETIRKMFRPCITLLLVPAIIAATILLSASAGICGSERTVYKQTNLVADKDGVAKYTDPKLVNSWGIIHSPYGPWWVNDNGTGFSTVYNGKGQPFPLDHPLIVTVPPPGSGTSTPTGIAYNGTKDFELAPGPRRASSFSPRTAPFPGGIPPRMPFSKRINPPKERSTRAAP